MFLSWSGEASRQAAVALRDWLPMVVQAIDPYMSSEDVEKGARWGSEIAEELEACNFGIICLTPENLEAPWILFEAGALSKSVDVARVSPLLLGLKPAAVTGPLVQFQFTLPERDDLLRLVTSINGACGDSQLPRERLERLFDALWPQLEEVLKSVVATAEKGTSTAPKRSAEDMLEELLELARNQTRSMTTREAEILAASGSGRPSNVVRRRWLMARETLNLPANVGLRSGPNSLRITVPRDEAIEIDSDALERLHAHPDFDGVQIVVEKEPELDPA